MAATRAMTTSSHVSGTLRTARVATLIMFFVNGAAFANWVVRIPAVRQDLGLSEGALGVALLGVAIGSLLTMPLTGWMVARYGSRPLARSAAILFCLVLPIPALAPSLITLALALVLIGATSGAMDVSMNAQAVAVEERYRRPIMSSFHAVFSFGGLAGSAMGGLIAWAGIDPLPHLILVGATLALVILTLTRGMLPPSADIVHDGPHFARPTRALAALGLIAFAVLLGEGAMADWTAVYLRDTVGAGAGLAAAGYAVFSLTMMVGRLVGDRVVERFGPTRVVRLGGILAAAGLILAVAIPSTATSLAGFGLVGAGFAAIFPVVLSTAARAPGLAPSVAIAAMATTGYFGFLAGPPIIGLAAEVTSLRGSLGIVAVLSILIALMASATSRHPASRGGT